MSSSVGEQSSRNGREIQVLHRISTEINATLDLTELFDTVLRTMDELFGFDHSLILLVDDTETSLEVVASHGYPDAPRGARVEVGSGLVGVVAKRRRMVRLGGLRQQRAYVSTIRREMEKQGRSEELTDAPSLPGLTEVESQIGIPLMVKDAFIGVFVVESAVKRTFSDADESLITVVANHAASAIHAARLLKELTEAHDRLAELNQTLEHRVRQRTEELQQKNRELRDTQAQLLQTAKLAALGDLVAGVAHEMNSPLGAIRGSADIARRASERVQRAVASELAADDRSASLTQALEALDGATSTALAASERIAGVLDSLRSFARLDEAERKKADLHEGIDSTLTLLRHKLQDRIDVVRNYGELPEILCSPSGLNQVFMNVLRNAIQAIDGAGTITISTRRERDRILLDFADTGHGISPLHLDRIFDPGFTTRGPKVGTGLGLAICHRILDEHGGTITAASEPGKGSVFSVRLPITH